jgi:ribosomal protein S18 acetylase RimI-like enzyme
VTGDDMVLRAVRADEWAQWRDVRVRMLREEAAHFGTRWEDAQRQPPEHWETWIAEAAAGVTKTLVVAEEANRWVGVAGSFTRIDRREVQLVSMWVDPKERGRGIARALIRAVAAWALERDRERVCLFVQETNVAAQELYRSAGFRPTGDREVVPRRRGFKLLFCAPAADLLG